MVTESNSAFIATLQQRRQDLSPAAAISPWRVHCWLQRLLGLLFPHLEDLVTPSEHIQTHLHTLETELCHLLTQLQLPTASASLFFQVDLPQLDQSLQADARGIYLGDPAAGHLDEVILSYPGFFAVAAYRVAHALLQRQIHTLPRLLTEYAHRLTGIDIHPGAQIGQRFCIDHGTGVVIGESTRIGDDVKLYQGVTLGALSVTKNMAHTKRHPTLEDRVVIYANATILGGETVIGHDSIIGGNVWLTASVPPQSVVYHSPQIKVRAAQVEQAAF